MYFIALYVGLGIVYTAITLFTFAFLEGRDSEDNLRIMQDHWDGSSTLFLALIWPITYLFLFIKDMFAKGRLIRRWMDGAYDLGVKSKMPKEKKIRIEKHVATTLKDEHLERVIEEELEDALINPKYKGASK
jgi:hypothetical protein